MPGERHERQAELDPVVVMHVLIGEEQKRGVGQKHYYRRKLPQQGIAGI